MGTQADFRLYYREDSKAATNARDRQIYLRTSDVAKDGGGVCQCQAAVRTMLKYEVMVSHIVQQPLLDVMPESALHLRRCLPYVKYI